MFDVVCKFHAAPDSELQTVRGAYGLLKPLTQWLGSKDPLLSAWYLARGKTAEESLQYRAYVDEINGETACLAVLAQEAKSLGEVGVSLWNGQESVETGAALHLVMSRGPFTSDLTLILGGSPAQPRIGDYKSTAEFLALAVCSTRPECGFVYHRSGYGNKQTFKDRPGVGWMLYLPRVFTAQELPEAQALLPVLDGKQRLGTIIVSVTDAVFDDNKPEHLQIAREIETRLVSNDWLPTWAQMVRLPA
jgi:hypothetical protein